MKFIKITYNNFKEATEPVSRDLTKSIKLANGKGKTTALDAIYYVLTNRLSTGAVTGWEHITTDNKLSGLEPLIELEMEMVEGVVTTFKLEKKKRTVTTNGVSLMYKTFADFKENYNVFSNLELYSNPYFIMGGSLTTNARRDLFINNYSWDELIKEVVQNVDLEQDFWPTIGSYKEVSSLLLNFQTESKSLQAKLEHAEFAVTAYKEQVKAEKISDDEYKNQIFLLERENKLASLLIEINKSEKFNGNCPTCGQLWESRIANNKKNRDDLADEYSKLVKEQLPKHNPDILENYKMQNGAIQRTKEAFQKNVDMLIDQISINSAKLDEVLKFITERNRTLDKFLKRDLPFKVKLFKKNKSNDGMLEVFTVLDEKGIDYVNMNRSRQLKIGVEMCQYFQKKNNQNIPIMIDNFEMVSDKKEYENFNILTTEVYAKS